MRKIKLTYLIDDDEIYIFTAKKLINKTDFSEEVKFFYNGKEALRAIKSKLYNEEELPDVILLDLMIYFFAPIRFKDKPT